MDVISLNIITCFILTTIFILVFAFIFDKVRERFDLENSICLVIVFVFSIITLILSLAIGSYPFSNSRVIHQTEYASFTVSGMNDGAVTITAKDKDTKEKTYKFDEKLYFKGGNGILKNQTSTSIDSLGKGNENQKYTFTVKEVVIDDFPILNFLKIKFEPLRTKNFEISEVP